MRLAALAILAGTMAAMMTVQADAASKTYVSHKMGFAVDMPGNVVSEITAFAARTSGPQAPVEFHSEDNNIKYAVIVFNYIQAGAMSATLLGEVEFEFQDKKKLINDSFSRIKSGKDWVYGRKLVADLPKNGGRTTGAFYFNKGYIIWLQATVLPANGDYDSLEPGQFVDSIRFDLSGVPKDAAELQLPEE